MSESATCRDSAAHEMSEDWQLAHEQLRRLARSRAGLDFEEGRWLLAAWRGGAHVRLGYGSFREYIERLFGYGARLVQDKLRVAEALEELPVLARALQTGQVCWSVLRELTRVARPETEAEWLAAAEGRTVREVERLVSGHAPGSRPSDARNAALSRHVLRFEVTGEVLASFREALSKLRRDAGEALDDDAALLLMARAVLQGPSDEGRSTYQVALTVCERCQRAAQQGGGEQVEVGRELVEMAACDGQHVGGLDGGAGPAAGANDTDGGTEHAHVSTEPISGDSERALASAPTQRAVQTIPLARKAADTTRTTSSRSAARTTGRCIEASSQSRGRERPVLRFATPMAAATAASSPPRPLMSRRKHFRPCAGWASPRARCVELSPRPPAWAPVTASRPCCGAVSCC